MRNESQRAAAQQAPDGEPPPSPSAPRPPSHTAVERALASWRPSARLEPVERYDRFEILGRIGRGGMAEILLARERSLTGGTRHLVIKRVLPEVRDLDEMLHMFLDETRVVMGLSHPNLCQIYEVGEHDGAWFIAMEWVNGVTLHQLLRRALESRDVDYGAIARVIAECAEALHYAHTARDAEGQLMHLVHRDVSPHNLMVAYDGRVKLLDFGIAKSSATTHRTEAGVVKGKVCYMAPEQWLTQPLDGRTDVFALGACLYEALSGRVAFKRETQLEVMRAALSGEVQPLSQIAPQVPAALAEIAQRALQTKPEHRFQSAREMSDALQRFLAGLSEPCGSGQVAAYARRLFHAEVQLGPVLERSQRGAQLARSEGLLLPPQPPALLGISRPPPASLPPLPPPFVFSAPSLPELRPPAVTVADASWPEPGVLEGDPPSERRRRATAVIMSVEPGVQAPSDAPTSPALPSLRELPLPPRAAEPRPLAKTLSMRVTQRARRAFAAAALLAAAVPAAYVWRSTPSAEPGTPTAQLVEARVGARERRERNDGEARSTESLFVDEGGARPGAFPAPVFTLLPPGAPLTEAPSSATLEPPRPLESQLSARLSINTRPWSTVYLGKRLLGSTPLADVPVPRGALMLRMVDRDGRVHLRRLPASKERMRIAFFEF